MTNDEYNGMVKTIEEQAAKIRSLQCEIALTKELGEIMFLINQSLSSAIQSMQEYIKGLKK